MGRSGYSDDYDEDCAWLMVRDLLEQLTTLQAENEALKKILRASEQPALSEGQDLRADNEKAACEYPHCCCHECCAYCASASGKPYGGRDRAKKAAASEGEAVAAELRCEVTVKRCADYGCAHPGAQDVGPEWRCAACRAYEYLTAISENTNG